MSQPVAVSSAICCSVALTSWVLVVVIDCTAIGWSLPMPTSPTISWRVLRRGASVGTGGAGMPKPTDMRVSYWNNLIGLTRSAVTVSNM